jgi:hypothetical protein
MTGQIQEWKTMLVMKQRVTEKQASSPIFIAAANATIGSKERCGERAHQRARLGFGGTTYAEVRVDQGL